MKDYFVRKRQSKEVASIYKFENIDNMYCIGKIKKHFLLNSLYVYIDEINKYSLIRSKGSALRECIGSFFRYYRGIEFQIINNKNVVGKVCFKEKRKIEITMEGDTYFIKPHGEGFFSVKKGEEQIALLKKEPVSVNMSNRYLVLYEPLYNKYMNTLLILFSVNDYFYFCDDLNYGSLSIDPCIRHTDDTEIYWRPSDSNDNMQSEAEIYLKYIKSLERFILKNNTIFVICLVCCFVFIYFIKFMGNL